jgi:hypothetical protein
LQWNGSAVQWAAGGAVSSFSDGTTGLLPNSPIGGAVVLGGVLSTLNGGTQVSSSGGIGNVLVSNGSVWTSQTPTSAGLASLTSNNTFTGYLGVGGAGTGAYGLNVNGPNGQAAVYITAGSTSSTGLGINMPSGNPYSIIFQYAGSNVGGVTVNSTSTTYNTSSDRRLKTNIASLTNSGTTIDALQPRTFTWNTTQQSDIGFIADELQSVIPQAVTGEPNAVNADGTPKYQQVDVSTPQMIAIMICELQLLRKRVAALEAK